MVMIPPGTFNMGGTQSNEIPVHQVTFLIPFAISRCEVTFADYELFAKATQREPPDDSGFGKANRPVINVSWDEAVAYTAWLSKVTGRHYRLPSEAEWEYAARAGTQTNYYWGDKDAKNYAWFYDNSNRQTQPVGQLKPNDFGLYDMSGNVYEWVQDCYEPDYNKAPKDGSAWDPKGCANSRVLRGGSWNNLQNDLRSATHHRNSPGLRDGNVGFRLAQDLP